MTHPDVRLIVDAHAAALARAAGAGHAPGGGDALDRLVVRVAPVIRHAVRRQRPTERLGFEPEDLEQLAWTKLLEGRWRRLLDFDPARGSLDAYVALVTRQAVAEARRTRAARLAAGLPLEDPTTFDPDAPDLERRVEQRQLLLQLVEWLEAHLGERAWRIFQLKYENGRSDDEIAETLGVGIQTVYNATFAIRTQARAFLRAAVGSDPPPGEGEAGGIGAGGSGPGPAPRSSRRGWHVHRTPDSP